ncbi:glycosyltransferase family 2 protein [Psychroflexus tropicus]|uniref:glycosyltransferase family 2 protein n=1 Tax=Psychroflexus tropicus TaxID=197345 RepID=UPI00038146E7|nr:glycosyltransferase family 2 protein [Psychroflexus tropicus]
MSDLVSIITPVYNSEAYILETIKSVQDQLYTNWEHILVDDKSSDNSPAIIKEVAKEDQRIKFTQLEENSGPAIARNKAIELAKGRYLAFLDADDIWFDFHLKDSLLFMEKGKHQFVFASYKRSNAQLKFVHSDFIVPEKVTYQDILKSNSISCLTAVVDISQLGKKYMPLIRKRQDMGLWLNYLKDLDYANGIQKPHAIYRMREDSLSRNKIDLIRYQWKFYRTIEKLSIAHSFYYLLWWTYLGYKKYRK